MQERYNHINPRSDPRPVSKLSSLRHLSAPTLICILLLATGTLHAQTPEIWSFDTINATVGFDIPSVLHPQVSFDRWGARHLTWVTRDPNSAGLQVYYANDVTGRLGSPFLLSDTGTIYDSVAIDTTSYTSLLDPEGFLHTLFVANVPEVNGLQIGLYYVNNRQGHLDSTVGLRLTTGSARYDLAVDSSGTPHAIWLMGVAGGIEIRYWRPDFGPGGDRPIDTIPAGRFASWVPCPVLDVSPNGDLHYLVRNDSGAVYLGSNLANGLSATHRRLSIPVTTQVIPSRGLDPLENKIRGALDIDRKHHLLVPFRDTADKLVRLYYMTDAAGTDVVTTLAELDSAVYGFDIRASGAGEIAMAWTRFRGRFPAEIPKSGYTEFVRSQPGVWTEVNRVDDLDARVGNPAVEWRRVERLDLRGGRVVVSLIRYSSRLQRNRQGIGTYSRDALLPEVRSILPDIAAAGMSVVVELRGPYENHGLFGADALLPEGVSIVPRNPTDSTRLIIGPSILSWDGRLLSVMFFVAPDAQPGPVPLQLVVNGTPSNTFTFTIVEPQRLGPNGDGRFTGGGVLGSGGIFGIRSPGGVIVVDSLRLRDGTYRVVADDPDQTREGWEGAMPLTILARGSVIIDSTAILSISAPDPLLPTTYGRAGPGGGGGGAGLSAGGGAGYTGGGPPGGQIEKGTLWSAPGSGSLRSGAMSGGGSPVGTPGGAGRPDVAGGGGTGHPYGVSGRYGGIEPLHPMLPDVGGVGGGTAGSRLETGITTGGGGGGHGTSGENGSLITRNGGTSTGSPVLVPLAGGSGGGGAFSTRGNAAGGGGGGALALYAERSLTLLGRIEADGGDGTTGQLDLLSSGGGGGSGGGVMIGAQGGIVLGGKGAISIAGGAGSEEFGPNGRAGGDGGKGRVRVDGRIDKFDESAKIESLNAGYFALATDMSGSFRAEDSIKVTGTGMSGRRVRIFHRRGAGGWSYNLPRDTIVDTNGTWSITIKPRGSGPLYVAALEQVDTTEGSFATGSPRWIMSTAGGLLIGTPAASLSVDDIDFGCVNFGACRTDTVFITNTGTQSDLFVRNPEIVGGNGWFTIGEFSPIRIPPGTTAFIPLRFCPSDTGIGAAILRFNTNLRPDSLQEVTLRGCGRAGELRIAPQRVDLGALCPEDCRDTTITLTNVGNAPLDVTRITVGDATLRASIISPGTPVRIEAGESREVRIRVCLLGSAALYSASFQATTPFASPSLLIEMENLGPDFTIPIDAPTAARDPGKTDTCAVITFQLKNLRTDAPLRIASILPRSSRFQVIAPAPGTSLAPQQSTTVRLQFCETSEGVYDDTLDLDLESGPCSVDTMIYLRGNVVRSVPELSLNVDEKIDLGTIPVGRASAPGSIRILNSGEGRGRDIIYRLEPIAPATAAEFVLSPTPGLPFDLRGGENYPITVTGTPAAIGLRSARVIVRTQSEDWIDTVTVCMTGEKPGIVADRYYVAFAPVRRGDRTTATVRFFNEGTSSDQIVGLALYDSTDFRILGHTAPSGSTLFPVLLRPSVDTMTVALEFQTSGVGEFVDTLRAITAGGEQVAVVLSALSGLERAVAGRPSIPFSCDTSEQSVVITNEGTWPLKIDRLALEGQNPEAFQILDQPGPDQLGPGESRTYRLLYVESESGASAVLRVLQSGPDGLTIRLSGEACAPELSTLTLLVPDLAAIIGDPLMIPLRLTTPLPLPERIILKITLRFEPGTLRPTTGDGAVRGLRGIAAAGSETLPGVVVIDAQIPAGTTSGDLLEVATTVLRGSHYRSEIYLDPDLTTIPFRYALSLDEGSITVLDCDTTGGVNLSNLFIIKQSLPNPAAGVVRIPFEIHKDGEVLILLYSADGKEQGVILREELKAGEHVVRFDLSGFAAGLYYYEVRSGEYRATGRMILRE